MKEIEDLCNWRGVPHSWIGRLMSRTFQILSNFISRFSSIPIKYFPQFLTGALPQCQDHEKQEKRNCCGLEKAKETRGSLECAPAQRTLVQRRGPASGLRVSVGGGAPRSISRFWQVCCGHANVTGNVCASYANVLNISLNLSKVTIYLFFYKRYLVPVAGLPLGVREGLVEGKVLKWLWEME